MKLGRLVGLVVLACALTSGAFALQRSGSGEDLPELTKPVNDFANIIDPASEAEIERVIRTLQAASGDVIVVVTVPTVEPYGDIQEYAVKLFQNHGRGIGDKGKDNGLLLLLALKERRVRAEVGYGLEPWITDGFAGQTSRDDMTPAFREGQYGAGLLAGTIRFAGRIAQGRNVQLTGVDVPPEPRGVGGSTLSIWWIILFFIIIALVSRIGGGPGSSVRRWGRRDGWSGWSSGVGPFGGGFGGGGYGGGGFGGGFGGFGGGRSGGGGGGASW